MRPYIPHLKINFDSIITYPRSVDSLIGNYKLNETQRKLLLDRFRIGTESGKEVLNYTGRVSAPVAKRIFKKVDLLLQISPTSNVFNRVINKTQTFKLVFITLTISSYYKSVSHKVLQRECLKPLLLWLKRSKGVKSYVWKAEMTKAGTIHYHLVTNKFIEYDQLRDVWNRHLNRLGLLDRQKELYGSKNANSTDIKAARSSKSVRNYVRKYLSKSNEDDQRIDGKVWDCSVNLKRANQYTDFLEDYTIDRLESAVKSGAIERKNFDYSTIFIVAPFLINSYLTDKQKAEYLTHINNIKTDFNHNKPPVRKSPKKTPSAQSTRLAQALQTTSQQELQMKLAQPLIMKSTSKNKFL